MVHQLWNAPAVLDQTPISGMSIGDPKVQYLLSLIHAGHSFCKSEWGGGDESLPKLCICKKRKNLMCPCGISHSNDGCGSNQRRDSDENSSVSLAMVEIDKLRSELACLTHITSSFNITKLKEELVASLLQQLPLLNTSTLINPPPLLLRLDPI